MEFRGLPKIETQIESMMDLIFFGSIPKSGIEVVFRAPAGDAP